MAQPGKFVQQPAGQSRREGRDALLGVVERLDEASPAHGLQQIAARPALDRLEQVLVSAEVVSITIFISGSRP